MATWSGIKKKLEKEYLAESLRWHIDYYVTSYSKSPDHHGRAAIRYDGKEIIKGLYWPSKKRIASFFKDKESLKELGVSKPFVDYIPFDVMPADIIDEDVIKVGLFDQSNFYVAFNIFDNQSIEESLKSNNLLVKIFAILDRRVGKRRLEKMKQDIEKETETFKLFYNIRAKVENII